MTKVKILVYTLTLGVVIGIFSVLAMHRTILTASRLSEIVGGQGDRCYEEYYRNCVYDISLRCGNGDDACFAPDNEGNRECKKSTGRYDFATVYDAVREIPAGSTDGSNSYYEQGPPVPCILKNECTDCEQVFGGYWACGVGVVVNAEDEHYDIILGDEGCNVYVIYLRPCVVSYA